MERRKKGFKPAIDVDDARRKREETTVHIRKEKKEQRLTKRRQGGSGVEPVSVMPPPLPGMGEAFGLAYGAPHVDPAVMDLIPQLARQLDSPSLEERLHAVEGFRKMLSVERSPPIQPVIDAGVVPTFVEFLRCNDSPRLQFEAAWALTNVASGTTEHTSLVIRAGSVPEFVRLLRCPNDDVREQAVWALGNIAGDSAECRDLVLAAGALPQLIEQLKNPRKLTMMRNATWTLSNFCRGKPAPSIATVRECLCIVPHLLEQTDEEVLTDACWALSYISDGPNESIQAVIEAGLIRHLVALLLHKTTAVVTPVLRTIGNIVTGDDLQTQVVINAGVLPCLAVLLRSAKRGIKKEACWTVSNITAGSSEQIDFVIHANIMPAMIALLSTAEYDIKKEAAWAISNATSGGSPEQIRQLVHQGCIRPLCDVLKAPDTKVISVALEGLDNIMRVGAAEMRESGASFNQYARFVEEAGGADQLEALQHHSSHELYEKVSAMLRDYFDAEEEDAGGMYMPAVSSDESHFVFGSQGADFARGGFDGR